MDGRRIWVVGALLGGLLSGGCDEQELEQAEVSVRGASVNGFALNGFALNGFALNGFALNGFALNGSESAPGAITLKWAVIPGVMFTNDIWVDDGELYVHKKGSVLSGAELEGAKLYFLVEENGESELRTLRLKEVAPLAPGSEVLTYDVEVRGEDWTWEPLCRDSYGAPTTAILIDGAWDGSTGARLAEGSSAATFACRDAGLAKCVELGYRPSEEVGGESLADVHAACARMIRADYCGDGTSSTVNGMGIHVLDQLGIQEQALDLDYVVEAEWGPDGATCLNLENTRLQDVSVGCVPPPCGDSFSSGGVLQSGTFKAP